jgi:hypothetical protein
MSKIDLTFFQEVGLILCRPSGVVYTNQAAGILCLHPEVEGVFCPLPVRPGRAELYALTQHFKGPWNSLTQEDADVEYRILTEEDADVVDRILRRNGHDYLKVDRTKLSDSYEAWVYVRTAAAAKFGPHETFVEFGECQGVLTWPNSD